MDSIEPRCVAAYCPLRPFCDGVPEKWAAGWVLEACSVGVDVATGGGGLERGPPWLVCGVSLSWGGGLGITFGRGFSTDSTCSVIEKEEMINRSARLFLFMAARCSRTPSLWEWLSAWSGCWLRSAPAGNAGPEPYWRCWGGDSAESSESQAVFSSRGLWSGPGEQ